MSSSLELAVSFHSQWKAKTKIDVTKIFRKEEWEEIALQSSYFTFTFTLSDRIMAAVCGKSSPDRISFDSKDLKNKVIFVEQWPEQKTFEANWKLSKNNGINCVLGIKHFDRSGFECKSDLELNIKCLLSGCCNIIHCLIVIMHVTLQLKDNKKQLVGIHLYWCVCVSNYGLK